VKLLILTLDTRGDVQPFVALPRGLANAGHEAMLAAPHRFEGFVGDQGVPFAGIDEPEVAGLLALLLLSESRHGSRTRADGSVMLLGEQDRTRWDRALIVGARRSFACALAATSPVPISSRRPSTPSMPMPRRSRRPTGRRSSSCTTTLLAVAPTPVVALNRAVAIGEVQGPAAALALVEELDLDSYHIFHATRADLLWQRGRHREAAAAYQHAATLAPTDAERDSLRLGGRASR
jgi:RNA polymerase sigma-70 factor (ECF subfamily)